MGYDMRFRNGKPEGEAERVSAAREAFHAAVKVRDDIPKAEHGFFRPGIDSSRARWGEVPYTNASPRRAAAENEVHRLYGEMYAVERSYFRLNISGMSVVRQAMLALGMAYKSSCRGDFPDYPDSEAVQQLIDEINYPEYASERKPGEIVREDDLFAARAYIQQRDAALVDHPHGGTAIPLHKFSSNDGWIVTPAECKAALKAWHGTTPEARLAALTEAGVTGPDWARIWARWIDYLTLAQDFGGFEVH